MKSVFVVGREWRFRSLLRAQLREQGYDARGYETLAEVADALVSAPAPALIVFDTTDSDATETAAYLRAWSGRLPVLVIASAQEAVPPGAASVLRRPVSIGQVATLSAELLSKRESGDCPGGFAGV